MGFSITFYHGHFVLGKRTGLIAADYLRTAKGFHGGQTTDNGISLGHVCYADG
ncbi:hypothetical protein SDC9_191205 [bioreactor metagenome]|uniref:Uncharacterized protein n=1 Tax=bioreactor metagenome TaxID=1076179 RepID=A0A645HX88_9ZZZZ